MEEEKEFSIFRKDKLLYVKNNKTINIKDQLLEINPLDFTVRINNEKNDFGKKIIDCIGIIGIISLEDNTYLIVITEAKLICVISKKEIYKIISTNFIKFTEEENEENNEKEKNNAGSEENDKIKIDNDIEIIKGLQDLFKSGFYFSNKYDLANSITAHNQILYFFQKGKLLSDYDYIVHGNKNFLANLKLTDKILSEQEKDENNIKFFFSNIIYGNIECFNYDKQNIQIILISRRYLWNFGVFQYRKGLSKYGGNSNQIETELILIYNNDKIFSNIFLSGYLPIYFKQNVDSNKANKAFIKYFQTLIDEYNLLFMFSLQKNNDKYIDKFNNIIIKNKISLFDKWKLYNIDSNKKTIRDILNNMKKKKDLIDFIGYNHSINIKTDKSISQIGIFFLLGMDDKILNENEFYLVYEIIYHILVYLNKNNSKVPLFLEDNIKLNLFDNNQILTETNIKDDSKDFIEKLKDIFIKRNQELSKQYYTNYNDELTQKNQRILEILFGKNEKQKNIKTNLNYLKEDFSEINNIKIYVATWNVGGLDLNKNPNLDLDTWLLPKNSEIIPDIYFIGFQEVVELIASNVLLANQEKLDQILDDWDKKINASIQKIGKYIKLNKMNLIGINFYCYVLEKNIEKISKVSNKKLKTGMGGTTGNKGSCCINFEYESTSISVACSHLAAGPNKNKSRQKELRYILNLSLDSFYNPQEINNLMKEEFDLFDLDENVEFKDENKNDILQINTENNILNLEEQEKSRKLKNSDIWILFGDLNFRVDIDYEEFSQFIKKGNSWDKLIDYDQLIKFKLASLDLIKTIQEDPIIFPPTYKYIKNTNEFDYASKEAIENQKNDENNNMKASKKKRNPSWCDRVIYKKNCYITKNGQKIISGTEYNSVTNENFFCSDHRPVYQIFDIIIFKEDKLKKDLIEKEILQNGILGISNKYMKKKKYDF